MNRKEEDIFKILSWLPPLFIWMCVVAFLKEYYGVYGVITGVMLAVTALVFYDLIRNSGDD